MAGGWTRRTHKSSYEVFSLTFWWMKTSYDNLQALPCYKISANYVTFHTLQGFYSSSKHLLEWKMRVESVQIRADMLAHNCMMTRLVCWNYECVVCSLITQKKRLIQNLFEITTECDWFLPVCPLFHLSVCKYVLYVQQIANVCVYVCVFMMHCLMETGDWTQEPRQFLFQGRHPWTSKEHAQQSKD